MTRIPKRCDARVRREWAVCLLLWAVAAGCQYQQPPSKYPLAPVRGRVTVNGVPQAGIQVYFESLSSRPSNGLTDADGRYELQFDELYGGAMLGTHVVRLTRNLRPALDPKPELPERYNKESEFKVRVEPGENVFNFELTEDPTPEQPAASIAY